MLMKGLRKDLRDGFQNHVSSLHVEKREEARDDLISML